MYRDCQVDRPARRGGGDPAIDPAFLLGSRTDQRCLRVVMEFVVDTTGRPDSATARVRTTDHPGLTTAVLVSLPRLRYEPARIANAPVRQVVEYTRGIVTRVPFTVGGGANVPPPSASRPVPAC